jgi:hypothetical protein
MLLASFEAVPDKLTFDGTSPELDKLGVLVFDNVFPQRFAY